ncbi:hypothetical protein RGQ29_001852 [Quercus rubra]|uniref:Uncharacterized protein n=1 Tax=Quercus rubra TaxID=3512 RepID=A0AAN7GAJ2_QUERU|nr:hypothetical protein RGQ29_001852 [Quercus rubra]
MAPYKDELSAVRVYTICDESRCKPMDAEDCEPFTDVFWIKFCLKKLDEFVFLGNRLHVSYAPQFESLSDTKDKLEGRRREALARLNPTRSKGPPGSIPAVSTEASLVTTPSEINPSPNSSQVNCIPQQLNSNQMWSSRELVNKPPITQVSSDKDYFVSQSMNQTVRLVREKFNKIQSSSEHLQAESASKKPRVDNRRRI